jgi:hypothetical protein
MFLCRLFIFSGAHVSVLVTVLTDSSCERIGKWDFEIRQIVGARLAGAPVKKLPYY